MLWVLSSVVAGLVTFAWTVNRDARREDARRKARAEMLQVELSDRTVQLVSAASALEVTSRQPAAQAYVDILRKFGFIGPPTVSGGGFQEFANRSVSSIAWELANLDGAHRTHVTRLISELHYLRLFEAAGPELLNSSPKVAPEIYVVIQRVYGEMNTLRPLELQQAYNQTFRAKEVKQNPRSSQ